MHIEHLLNMMFQIYHEPIPWNTMQSIWLLEIQGANVIG